MVRITTFMALSLAAASASADAAQGLPTPSMVGLMVAGAVAAGIISAMGKKRRK